MGIRIIEGDIAIERKLQKALIAKLERSFYNPQHAKSIAEIVKVFVRKLIVGSDVYRDILSSNEGLTAHLGIPRERKGEILTNLLNAWLEQIECIPLSMEQGPRQFRFKYRFNAIEADWAKILAHPDAKYANESRRAKRGEAPNVIPFLEWLLVAGDQLQIVGFKISEIKEGSRPTARSGAAIMIKPKSGEAMWRIPVEYGANSPDNNFITRAIDNAMQNEGAGLKRSLLGTLKKIGNLNKSTFDSFFQGGLSDNDIDILLGG